MMFHEGSRELQDRFDTRRIAERIDDVPVADTIDDRSAAFIGRQEMFFLATADAEGRPTCSYKGGDRASSGRRRADRGVPQLLEAAVVGDGCPTRR